MKKSLVNNDNTVLENAIGFLSLFFSLIVLVIWLNIPATWISIWLLLFVLHRALISPFAIIDESESVTNDPKITFQFQYTNTDYNCPSIRLWFLIVSGTFTETLETIYKPAWTKWATTICRR